MAKKTTLTQWMVKPNRPFYQQPWYWGAVGAVALFFLSRGKGKKGDSGKWPTILGPLGGIKWGTPTTRQWKGQPVGFMSGRKYTNTRKNLAKYTMKVAKDMGIPPEGLAVQFWVESQYNRNIVSPVGAKGIAQFMPLTGAAYGLVTGVTPAMEKEYKKRYRRGTAAQKMAAADWLLAQPGVTDNRDDARASIVAGAKYMKRNYTQLDKNWANAVGAYNCGAGCMKNRLRKGTLVPKETQNYIAAIAPYYHSTPVPTLVGPQAVASHPWPTKTKASA
jgi:hypothetical protein